MKKIFIHVIQIGRSEIFVDGFIGGFEGPEFEVEIPLWDFHTYAKANGFFEGYSDDANYYEHPYSNMKADLTQFILSKNLVK